MYITGESFNIFDFVSLLTAIVDLSCIVHIVSKLGVRRKCALHLKLKFRS